LKWTVRAATAVAGVAVGVFEDALPVGGPLLMLRNHTLHRRNLLQIAALFGAAGAMSPLRMTLAQSGLRRTPEQILGPFYPILKAASGNGDLTRIPGHAARAEGEVINVMGHLLNIKGEPVAGARIEVWQANSAGRYTHPADRNPAPLDPNFEGFAAIKTDANGRYRFRTIKPGAYPVTPGVSSAIRPPHIHFRITGRTDELVTQMYFPDEALNEKDQLLQSVAPRNRDLLVAKVLPPTSDQEPGSRLVIFDLVTLIG
jgi:protocatechuate 3,4-dioxygenase beta subunit